MQLNRAVMIKQARAAFERNSMLQAQTLCQQVLQQNRNDGEALLILHHVAARRQQSREAVDYLERFIKQYPKNAVGHATLGEFYLRNGRYREAISRFQKLLAMDANHPGAIAGLARAYDHQGEKDKARAVLHAHMAKGNERPEVAYVHADFELEAKNYQETINVAVKHASNASTPPELRKELWFVAGRAYEAVGNDDAAFEAYRSAHAVAPINFDIDAYSKFIDQMIEVFSREKMKRLPHARNDSRLPVFVVCRPRSGSTLLEKIIGAHPKVHTAGELDFIPQLASSMNLSIGSQLAYPQCVWEMQQPHADELGKAQVELLRQLAPQAQRVVNKHLNTWVHLGLVSLLLPKAIIIDLRRDAVDNCLACYTENLGSHFPYQRDLRLLGAVHRQYERLMNHWRETLEIPMLQINYEDLVSDQETWSRRVIEFIGLEWDDRVLAFHKISASQTSSSAAPTPSYQQVRQGIYKTSVGRAAKFEKHIAPLREALSDPAVS